MADTAFLDQAWNDFDPLEPVPADDHRGWYQDLWAVRGTGDVSGRIVRQVERATGRPPQILLLGHAGSGKSTELGRIRHELEGRGWRCLSGDVDRDLDKEDIDLPDIQLLLVERLVELMGELQHGLSTEHREGLVRWFSEETEVRTTTAGGGLALGAVARLLLEARTEIKLNRERRHELRCRVRRRLREFVDLVAELVGEATGKLQIDGFAGLAIVVDGLEKARLDAESGRTRAASVLLDQSEQWAALRAPLLVTAPLTLLAESQRLTNHYDDFHLVPAVPVVGRPDRLESEPDPGYCREGRRLLCELVGRRASVDRLFASAGDLDALVRASGGSVRDLFRLIRAAIDAAVEEGGDRIDATAAQCARDRQARQVTAVKRQADLSQLRTLLKDPEAFDYDPEGLGLLARELVLPYSNGGQWFGVHPALLRLLDR